jgi:hypothetical protein
VNTDQLIAALVEDIKPVRRHAVGRRLAIGIGAGALGTLVVIALWLGFNPQLDVAMRHYHFWMKWGLHPLPRAVRGGGQRPGLPGPDSGRMGWLWVMALPVASLAALGIFEMSRVPPAQWFAMWLGESWSVWLLDRLSSSRCRSSAGYSGRSGRPRAHTASRGGARPRGLTAGAWGRNALLPPLPGSLRHLRTDMAHRSEFALAALAGALIGPRLLRW